MKKININFKKLVPHAGVPSYAHPGDAGMDLKVTSIQHDEYGNIVYGTGIAVEIPDGYVGLVFPRSSNCKKDLYLTNSVGVIDSGYRGEIFAKFRSPVNRTHWWDRIFSFFTGRLPIEYLYGDAYTIGDKVVQLIIMPYPTVEFKEVEELSNTERGDGGYGSTGK